MSASERLQAAAMTALRAIDGIGVFDGPPLQAAFPYALAETGPALDWSHKSGTGRELRIAVTIRDQGESPARAQRLASEAEAAIAAIGGDVGGWQVVTMKFVRSQTVRPPREPWASLVEFRARLLAV